MKKEDIDIHKIASLARLQLTSDQATAFHSDLLKIFDHFESLSQVDMTDKEPLTHPTQELGPLRDDSVSSFSERELALNAAPDRSGDLFRVPPVL